MIKTDEQDRNSRHIKFNTTQFTCTILFLIRTHLCILICSNYNCYNSVIHSKTVSPLTH